MRKLTIKRVEMFVRVEEDKDFNHWWVGDNKLSEDTIHTHYSIAIGEKLGVKKSKDIKRLDYCLKFIIANRKMGRMLQGEEEEPKRFTVIPSRGHVKSEVQYEYLRGIYSGFRAGYTVLDDLQEQRINVTAQEYMLQSNLKDLEARVTKQVNHDDIYDIAMNRSLLKDHILSKPVLMSAKSWGQSIYEDKCSGLIPIHDIKS